MQYLLVDSDRPLDWVGADDKAVRGFTRAMARLGSRAIDPNANKVRTDAFDAAMGDFQAQISHTHRTDAASAGQGLWAPMDLVARAKEIFAEPEPDMIMSHVPVQRNGDMGLETVELVRESYSGQGVVYASGNGRDARTASVSRTRTFIPLLTLLVRVEDNWLDKQRARATGRDTMTGKMRGAKRALNQAANELFLVGDNALGLPGLLANNIYIPRLLSATSVSSASTAAAIVNALCSQIDAVRRDSRGGYIPDTAFLGGGIMDYISTTLVDTGSGRSILEFIEAAMQKKYPGFKIKLVDALNARGPAAASEVTLVGRFQDRANMSAALEVTMEPVPIANVVDGLVEEIYMAMVVGGAHPRHPAANSVGFYDT